MAKLPFGFRLRLSRVKYMFWLDDGKRVRIIPQKLADAWIKADKVIVVSQIPDGLDFYDVTITR